MTKILLNYYSFNLWRMIHWIFNLFTMWDLLSWILKDLVQRLTEIQKDYSQLDMDSTFNSQVQSRLWLHLDLTTMPTLMAKKWTEPQLKNFLITITIKKLLKLTEISQDLDSLVKEKYLLICRSTLDHYLDSQNFNKPQETMIQKEWPLRSLILLIAPRLKPDAWKMLLIYLMMQLDPKLKLWEKKSNKSLTAMTFQD